MLSLTLNVVLPGPEAAVVENLTVARQSAIIFMKKKTDGLHRIGRYHLPYLYTDLL